MTLDKEEWVRYWEWQKNEDETIRYGDNSMEDPITVNDNYIVDEI